MGIDEDENQDASFVITNYKSAIDVDRTDETQKSTSATRIRLRDTFRTAPIRMQANIQSGSQICSTG